jgi:hypothetical protein
MLVEMRKYKWPLPPVEMVEGVLNCLKIVSIGLIFVHFEVFLLINFANRILI